MAAYPTARASPSRAAAAASYPPRPSRGLVRIFSCRQRGHATVTSCAPVQWRRVIADTAAVVLWFSPRRWTSDSLPPLRAAASPETTPSAAIRCCPPPPPGGLSAAGHPSALSAATAPGHPVHPVPRPRRRLQRPLERPRTRPIDVEFSWYLERTPK